MLNQIIELVDYFRDIIGFSRFEFISAVVAIITAIFGISIKIFGSKKSGNIINVNNVSGGSYISIVDYEEILRKRESEIEDRLKQSLGVDHHELQIERDMLLVRLSDVQKSYDDMREKFTNLSAQLDLSSDPADASRLQSAVDDLKAGNSEQAEIKFKDIIIESRNRVAFLSNAYQGLGILYGQRGNLKKSARAYAGAAYLSQEESALEAAVNALSAIGSHDESLDMCLILYELRSAKYGSNSAELARCTLSIGSIYYNLGDIVSSRARFLDAQRIFGGLGMKDTKDNIANLIGLANCDIVEHNYESAERRYREALVIDGGDKDSSIYSYLLNGLAESLRLNRKFQESEMIFEKLIDYDKHKYGVDHIYVARDLNFYAKLKMDNEDYYGAIELLARSFEINTSSVGFFNENSIGIVLNLTSALRLSGDAALKDPWYSRLREIYGASLDGIIEAAGG